MTISPHTNGFAESAAPLDPDASHGLLDHITRVTYTRYAVAPPADVVALLSACSQPMPAAIYWTIFDERPPRAHVTRVWLGRS